MLQRYNDKNTQQKRAQTTNRLTCTNDPLLTCTDDPSTVQNRESGFQQKIKRTKKTKAKTESPKKQIDRKNHQKKQEKTKKTK